MNFLKRGSAQRARNERCEQPPKTGEGSIKSTFCEINYFSVLVYGDCERQDWFIRIARRVSPRGCGLCRAKRTPREQLEITSVLGSIKCVMIITKLSLALKFEFKNILEGFGRESSCAAGARGIFTRRRARQIEAHYLE
jgi:hypothetical protein